MQYIAHSYGKGRSRYRMAGNLWYCLKALWEWKRAAVFIVAVAFIPTIVSNYSMTLLPVTVVRDLEAQSALQTLFLHIAGLCVLMWIGDAFMFSVRTWFERAMPAFLQHFRKRFSAKIMDLDYMCLEDESCREVIGNVIAALRHGRGLYMLPKFLVDGSCCVIQLVFYGALIARVGLWLLAVVMLTVVLNYILLAVARKKYTQYYGENSRYATRTDYISSQASDASAGKDIRMYRLTKLFLDKYEASLREMDRLFGKIHFWYQIRGVFGGFLTLARNGIIYGVLVYLVTEGRLTASELVYYVSLLSTFAGYFNWIVYLVMGCNSANVSIGYIRDFLSWENRWTPSSQRKPVQGAKREAAKLELRHVSFAYPGSKSEVLKDVNLIIRPGEKLALLGLNGAGKTTLVKLICGFYEPTAGEILLNDIPVREYEREEYYSLLSVLFQDHTILPMSLDENLTGTAEEKLDRKRLERALKLSGFAERYERLPQKGKTRLVREVEEDSVNFSGGEYQKLLFARALYQKAPLMILDEPTAALDPIAENELYQNFGKAMENTTAIYISHRLASTQFCDRIVLLENGRITEEGTHDGLMRAKGRYAELYRMQSSYYS